MLTFFFVFAIVGSFLVNGGCIYLSVKFKRPFLYFEIKELASKGNALAKSLIWICHLSILSAVLFGVFGIVRFF